MNPRRAAALVLVGWYLMVPPLSHDRTAFITDAPLSHWRVEKAFDTAQDCENYSTYFWGLLKDQPTKQKIFRRNAQCISTDDPRLKEK